MTTKPRHTVTLSGGVNPPTPGQVAMIQDAGEFGDVIILLNSDGWCAHARQASRPFLSYEKRKKILDELPFVSRVIPADDHDGTVINDLRQIAPDFFGNGGERTPANTPETAICKELGIGMLWFLGDQIKPSAEELLRQAMRLAYDETDESRRPN